jgi:hypothetical protein
VRARKWTPCRGVVAASEWARKKGDPPGSLVWAKRYVNRATNSRMTAENTMARMLNTRRPGNSDKGDGVAVHRVQG